MTNDDMISRQNVLRYLTDISYNHCKTQGEADVIDTAKTMVAVMSSAQPEIIRCHDCKHFEYDHPYIIQGVPILGHEVCNAWGNGCKTDENGYCFLAERRTDGVDC